MTRSSEPKNPDWYNNFYASGGWNYDPIQQSTWLNDRLFLNIDIEPGSRILEIGCGEGAQAEAMRLLGYDVTAVDFSDVGIAHAKERYPKVEFIAMDAADMDFPDGSFDMVFIRGMSWYHYELDERCRERTAKFMQFIKPGGYFALLIKTDFSGEWDESGVLLNKFDAYVDLFSPFGDIVLCTDWLGKPLRNAGDAVGSKNIIIVTRVGACGLL